MAKGGSLLSTLIAIALGLALLMVAQQCFLTTTPTPPSGNAQPRHAQNRVDLQLHNAPMVPMEGDFAAGSLFAGSEALSLEGADREVNVAMFNKKRTKRDRSEGWTLRKKFRSCSLLARAATAKGRKILKKRMWRGKKVLAPGDYCNYKMQSEEVALGPWGALTPRPSFPPGTGLSKAFARQRLDVQTVLQCLFFPWLLFCATYALLSCSLHFYRPSLTYSLVALAALPPTVLTWPPRVQCPSYRKSLCSQYGMHQSFRDGSGRKMRGAGASQGGTGDWGRVAGKSRAAPVR
ncbi:unnamed protein product, partial [Symbiodinium necroappetens]